ncbi:hypothetical protein BFP75_01575 [Maribacter sp. 4G9]|nr:hypothetical protein BFP75_01575 [Maribacter sp. 4G9]
MPNYGDNPEHYKRLISKINEEANFPMYLNQNEYTLIKKSAGSMEFKNDTDCIVLQTARNPMTYFNRNDSNDKGLFFTYLKLRKGNFYKAVQEGLEIVNRIYDLGDTTIEIQKPKTVTKSLEEKYNIVPLRNSNYIRVHRGISKSTINSIPFRGRIFNAYHIRDNGGKIANIAFPKYDLEGMPKNYILHNKPYRSKKDNKIKKFRLVLNQKDHLLFFSKPIADPNKIVFGESGIDLLSYHELHGKSDNFYVSFGGNVYQEKLHSFIHLTEPQLKNNEATLVSIMDNDAKGHEFDIKIFSALINHYNPNVYVESSFKNDNVSLNIHYTEKVRSRISVHRNLLNDKLTSDIPKDNTDNGLVKCIGFSDKLVLEFNTNAIAHTDQTEQKGSILKTLMDTVNGLYLPFPTQIHKSEGKDWNDDLRASKKLKYQKTENIQPAAMNIGDKIKLKTTKGPEGGTNVGTIKAVQHKSVECDFGLNYTYAIPFSAIGLHLKRRTSLTPEKKDEKLNKNNNLQNLSV